MSKLLLMESSAGSWTTELNLWGISWVHLCNRRSISQTSKCSLQPTPSCREETIRNILSHHSHLPCIVCSVFRRVFMMLRRKSTSLCVKYIRDGSWQVSEVAIMVTDPFFILKSIFDGDKRVVWIIHPFEMMHVLEKQDQKTYIEVMFITLGETRECSPFSVMKTGGLLYFCLTYFVRFLIPWGTIYSHIDEACIRKINNSHFWTTYQWMLRNTIYCQDLPYLLLVVSPWKLQ